MKKASEYRLHAKECRDLAAKMDLGVHRDQLLQLAAHWENLAEERLQLVRRHPELALPGEGEADGGPGGLHRSHTMM
jgi:hypothetical protein